MKVVSCGPLRAGSVLWQPRPGAWALTVVCKATFELIPGESPLIFSAKNAPEAGPQAVVEQRRLLEMATDHVPLKRVPEVLLVGHAYAPEGTLVTSLAARLAIGDVDKMVHVFGDRYFTLNGALAGPAHFTKMPLLWERAAGGPGTSNPVGVRMGADALADAWGRIGLPNFQPAGQSITARGDGVAPIGFGPIAPSWPTRMVRLHRHAATWDPTRWHERPLPEDVDFAYFNAAPSDQVLKELTGHERIVLENLHPRVARLVTHLRVVTPCVTATVEGDASREVHMRCDTLVLDTDRGTATLVWRGNVPLDHPEREGTVLVSDGQSGECSEVETALPSAALAPVMPFREAVPRESQRWAMMPAGIELRGEEAMAWPATPPRALPVDDGTRTVVGSLMTAAAAPALPFAKPAEDQGDVQTLPPTAWQAREVEPSREMCPVDRVWEEREAEPGRVRTEALPAWSEALVEPPPMVGPLARPAVGAGGLPEKKKTGLDEEEEKAAESARAVEEPLPLDTFPMERCARIEARLACSTGETAEILRAEELDASGWQKLHTHWLVAIREETDRRKKTLLSKYDGAYVSELEAQRGPITLNDYARLAEGAERGVIGEEMARRGLPAAGWPNLQRVWIDRMVRDVRVGKEVRRMMDVARAVT